MKLYYEGQIWPISRFLLICIGILLTKTNSDWLEFNLFLLLRKIVLFIPKLIHFNLSMSFFCVLPSHDFMINWRA